MSFQINFKAEVNHQFNTKTPQRKERQHKAQLK